MGLSVAVVVAGRTAGGSSVNLVGLAGAVLSARGRGVAVFAATVAAVQVTVVNSVTHPLSAYAADQIMGC